MGRVSNYIQSKVKSGEALHFTLIDPDKATSIGWLRKRASTAANSGTDAFLVGGSIGVSKS
ncbi:MAG: geranylgeranylglyceryl/heptaprenylglyceryl phosphate synthase, partial [Thermoprotei archaeon]